MLSGGLSPLDDHVAFQPGWSWEVSCLGVKTYQPWGTIQSNEEKQEKEEKKRGKS